MLQPPTCAAICESSEPWMEGARAPGKHPGVAAVRGRPNAAAVGLKIGLPLICLNRLVYKQGSTSASWA
jgi:hypothetical protein